MSFTTYASGLYNAFGITFDSSNNLYIANSLSNNIIKVDILGNQTIFASGFTYTENVAFDNIGFPNGYLYVMDGNDTIYKVDSNGNKTAFALMTNGHYIGMTFDTNNNLYYTSAINNIYKVDINGNTTTFINGTGVLNYPISISFDSIGNLFIANIYTEYVSKYDSNGNLITKEFILIPNNVPNSLIIDSNNYIYVSYGPNIDVNGTYIYKYDSSGNFISTIYNDPTGSILGLAVDSVDNLYFTNNNYTIITKYTLPSVPCFKEYTRILTDKGYIHIQDLRKGDLIKTLNNDFKPINMIGKKDIYHHASQQRLKNQLYKYSQTEFPEIFEDLIITGCHSVLIDNFTSIEQKEKVIEINGKIYITDNKYRLPACADSRASVYEIPGTYTIYHLALDNDEYYMNYGIYANGLLVETCSKRYLKELSNMELIE